MGYIPTQKQFLRNIELKEQDPDFIGDIEGLLRTEIEYDQEEAFDWVKAEGKDKELVVDYIGIKKQMNLALAQFGKTDKDNFEDIQQSITVVRDHLDLLARIFHRFDTTPYFQPPELNPPENLSMAAEGKQEYQSHGFPLQQLYTLNMAAEYVQSTQNLERRFKALVDRYNERRDSDILRSEVLERIVYSKNYFSPFKRETTSPVTFTPNTICVPVNPGTSNSPFRLLENCTNN